MASIVEMEEVLEAAVAGIPQVAQVIAGGPREHREKALAAAERSYLKTARDLGWAEVSTRNWVNTVMDRLRAQVEDGASGNAVPAGNSVGHDVEGDQTKRAINTDIASGGRLALETEISRLVQKTYVHDTQRDSFSDEACSDSAQVPLTKLAKLLHADGALSDEEFKALKTTPSSKAFNPPENYASGRSGRAYMSPLQAVWRIVKFPLGVRG